MSDELIKHSLFNDGYGLTGNLALDIVLEKLSPSEREEYEKELLEKDRDAFLGFKEWQKTHNEYKKRISGSDSGADD